MTPRLHANEKEAVILKRNYEIAIIYIHTPIFPKQFC